jgi:hypothetical protein
MAEETDAAPAERAQNALRAQIPQIYFNGFLSALTTGDVQLVLERNGVPVAVLNVSYTVAKTLGVAIGALISNLEGATKRTIMTSSDIQQALTGGEDNAGSK